MSICSVVRQLDDDLFSAVEAYDGSYKLVISRRIVSGLSEEDAIFLQYELSETIKDLRCKLRMRQVKTSGQTTLEFPS